MFDLQTMLIPKIAERCRLLREENGLRMEDISDKASISRIEKQTLPASGNFITETVLSDYKTTFDCSYQEIIFGSQEELEVLLNEMFDDLFRTIKYKALATHATSYKLSTIYTDAQEAMISMAELFAEYNLQRYHFSKTDDLIMDNVTKTLDKPILVGDQWINIQRDWRKKPINEETVIDCWGMAEKMWFMCKEKMVRSFQIHVISPLFESFAFKAINPSTTRWIKQEVCNRLIPEVVTKLKSNTIFKLGQLVKQLIQEFINDELPESFQTTVPLKRMRTETIQLRSNNFNTHKLTKEQLNEQTQLWAQSVLLASNNMLPDPKLAKKLADVGIIVELLPEEMLIEEVDIDDLLARALSSRKNGPTKNKPLGFELEESPIMHSSDFHSFEEENLHFDNQQIPGYFTNNSQFIQRLQEHLNEAILSSVEDYIHLQNNLLNLLREEDLVTFAK